jgi:ribosomal protein S27AE
MTPSPLKPKVPWLPSEVPAGQKTEACPRCGAHKFMPWTLRRDPQRVTLLRTWVCAACQATEERHENDDAAV